MRISKINVSFFFLAIAAFFVVPFWESDLVYARNAQQRRPNKNSPPNKKSLNCEAPANKEERYRCYMIWYRYAANGQGKRKERTRVREQKDKKSREIRQKKIKKLQDEREKERKELKAIVKKSRDRNISNAGQAYRVNYGAGRPLLPRE